MTQSGHLPAKQLPAPAGGISIGRDDIVKQHGGSIDVNTQSGEFTEFRIVLPRTAATIAN
jgi:signal transduction histidine kinase